MVSRAHLEARAFVVHSDDARVLGEKLSTPGFQAHDWDLVVLRTNGGEQKLHVDPTLYDRGWPSDIARSVSGDVKTP